MASKKPKTKAGKKRDLKTEKRKSAEGKPKTGFGETMTSRKESALMGLAESGQPKRRKKK